MPSPETLNRFIARVLEGAHAEAIVEFYTVDSCMRENQHPPRIGRDANAARERATLSRVKSVKSSCMQPVLAQGDTVVIRWIFEFEDLDGRKSRLEELAYQRWEGELIADEQFFYDPAQFKS